MAMSEYDIRALDKAISSVNTNVGEFRKEVKTSLNALEKILNWLDEIRKDIINGFRRVASSQAQMMLAEKAAELETFQNLIETQKIAIEEKINIAQEDLSRAEERFANYNRDLKKNFEDHLHNLDGHIVCLIKNYYEERAGIGYHKYATPLLNAGEKYYLDCAHIRYGSIENLGGAACQAISEFIDMRGNFGQKVNKYKISGKVDNYEPYELPIIVFITAPHAEPQLFLPGNIGPNKINEKSRYSPQGGTLADSQEPETDAPPLCYTQEISSEYFNWNKIKKIAEKAKWSKLTAEQNDKMHDSLDLFYDKGLLNENDINVRLKEMHWLIDSLDIEIGE
jgi:hypothetical protein